MITGKARVLPVLSELKSPGRRDGTEWPTLREGFEEERHAHLGPGVTLRGRVMLAPETPAGGAWIAVACESTTISAPTGATSQPRIR